MGNDPIPTQHDTEKHGNIFIAGAVFQPAISIIQRSKSLILLDSVVISCSKFPLNIQGVHKVSLKFQKFITNAIEKTNKWKLLQNETYIFKFFCLI
jgi:hypothetical protein